MFYNLDIDVRDIYVEHDGGDVEAGRQNDYTIAQVRSFAFCKAEQIAINRLNRLDEFRAILNDLYGSEKTNELKKLKEEINGSHLIEEKAKKLTKEEMMAHNRKAVASFKEFNMN